jgi:hypothetical protein
MTKPIEYQILTLLPLGNRKKGTFRTQLLFNIAVKSNAYGEIWRNNEWLM